MLLCKLEELTIRYSNFLIHERSVYEGSLFSIVFRTIGIAPNKIPVFVMFHNSSPMSTNCCFQQTRTVIEFTIWFRNCVHDWTLLCKNMSFFC